MNNNCRMLCAGGMRATIEAICKNLGVVDGPVEKIKADGTKDIKRESNLNGRINGLAEKNILTQRPIAGLHKHRYMGNDALHDIVPPEKKDLETALKIIEHMLEHIYEMPVQSDLLQKK